MELKPVEQTLALIKPDAVKKGKAKEIMQLIEMMGFTIVCQDKLQVRSAARERLTQGHAVLLCPPVGEHATLAGTLLCTSMLHQRTVSCWRDEGSSGSAPVWNQQTCLHAAAAPQRRFAAASAGGGS